MNSCKNCKHNTEVPIDIGYTENGVLNIVKSSLPFCDKKHIACSDHNGPCNSFIENTDEEIHTYMVKVIATDCIEIEAKSMKDAMRIARNEIYDFDDFDIDKIELIE